ncbi:MAG: Flp family type IVb pilin [Acidobacteria bacterium]|nr:Flp family type IVb pilin [Acidobacteriota bacterium]
MITYILNFIRREDGADMVEYALILALVSIVAIATLTSLGTSVDAVFGVADSAMAGAS